MDAHTRNALLYATIVAMGGLLFGLDAALISGGTDLITEEFSLDSAQLGTAVSAPALGVLLALPFAGYISNRFGRKTALLLMALAYLVSAVVSTVASSYGTLVAARFLGGLAFSSISLASMYIGEIAPPRWRGKLVSMTQINIVVGLSGAYFINYLIHDWASSNAAWAVDLGIAENEWRWMLGSEIPFAVLWLGLLFLIPESPYWLVARGRESDAERTLCHLLPEEAIGPHITEMRESLTQGTEELSPVAQLYEVFSPRMRMTFIIAMTIAIAQQSTGINAILFYVQTVFKQLGVGDDAAFSQAVWVGLTGLVFTVLGLLLVDKLGRRPLMIGGMVWIVLSLGLCSYLFHEARYVLTPESIAELTDVANAERLNAIAGVEYESDLNFKRAIEETLGKDDAQKHQGLLLEKAAMLQAWLVLAGILSFIAAFHFSVGPVMWVLFSEIFPISVRAIAIPFFTIVTSLTNYVVQKFFPWQLENMGMSSIFLTYAAVVAVGAIILCFTLIETKGLSIEEIQARLEPGRSGSGGNAPQEGVHHA